MILANVSKAWFEHLWLYTSGSQSSCFEVIKGKVVSLSELPECLILSCLCSLPSHILLTSI